MLAIQYNPSDMKMFILTFQILMTLAACSEKVDIEPTLNDEILSAYPSPMSHVGYVAVSNSTNQTGIVKVFDPAGDIILEETVPSGNFVYPFDVRGTPLGKYQVIYKLGSTVVTKNLIRV